MYHKKSAANMADTKIPNAYPIVLTRNIGSRSFLASLVVLYGGLILSGFKLSIKFFSNKSGMNWDFILPSL